MHAVKLILEDHEKIRNLFAQLDNTLLDKPNEQILKTRKNLFEELTAELLRHETMEQSFLYPFIKHHAPFKNVIEHLVKEEKEASNLISDFRGVACDSADWVKKYQALQRAVEHHTTEEETKLLPKVMQSIPEKLLNNIGTEMHTFKREARTARRR